MHETIPRSSHAPPPRHGSWRRVAALCALGAPAVSQTGFLEPGYRALPHLPGMTQAIAAGDIDGDGDVDLVLARRDPAGVGERDRVFVNDGRGTFADETSARLPTVLDQSFGVSLVDVDGDLDPDLVIVGEVQNRLLLNDGNGAFADVTAGRLPQIGQAARSIVAADFDGDGDADLVLGTDSANRMLVNDGSGTFLDLSPARISAVISSSYDLAVGDLDGDGDLDLVAANRAPSPTSGGRNGLYLNDGAGRLNIVGNAFFGFASCPSVALGDVDGDGDLDVVFGRDHVGFGASTPTDNQLFLSDGSGTFTDATARLPSGGELTRAVAMADVDGDGDLDLIAANGSLDGSGAQDYLFVNDGSGTFAYAPTPPDPDLDEATDVLFADVDGDGDPDLLTATTIRNRLALGDGAGGFVSVTTELRGLRFGGAHAVVAGDLDGDGRADLVIVREGDNQVLLQRDHGRLGPTVALAAPAFGGLSKAAALGDVDGDGDLDMLVANYGGIATAYSGEYNRLFKNDGTGTLTPFPYPTTLQPSTGAAFVDVDGDGDLDAVVSNGGLIAGNRDNELLLNDGGGTFTPAPTQIPGNRVRCTDVAAGDIDNDGDADLVFANHDGANLLYLNDGTGTFTDVTATAMPQPAAGTPYHTSIDLGDFDGDGWLDNVVGTGAGAVASTPNRLFRNRGNGTFVDTGTARMPATTEECHDARFADLDHDGDLDIVLANADGRCRVFFNTQGGQQFVDGTGNAWPDDDASAVALGLLDVDTDGDTDLVLVGRDRVRWMANLVRHIDARSPPVLGQPFALDSYAVAPTPRVAVTLLSTGTGQLSLPFGTLGLDPTNIVTVGIAVLQGVPAVTGSTIAVPNLAALVGLDAYTQAVLVDVARPANGSLTHVRRDPVLR